MKTLLKIVGGVLAVIVVLVAGAVLVVPLVVDPNAYKGEIVDAVREQTGRELTIGGDIGLTVFPWLGLELGDVELGNAPGFPEPYFARVDSARVRVKLLPLVQRNLEMDTVRIEGLKVHLAKNDKGTTNWDDLVKVNDEQPVGGRKPGGASSMAALAIGGLDVRGAAITWKDAAAGQSVKVQNLSVKTGGLSLDKPVELSLEFDVEDVMPGLGGHVTATAVVSFDLERQRYRADGLSVSARLADKATPDQIATIKATASEGTFDLASQNASVADLSVQAVGLALGGLGADLTVTGDLKADLAAQVFEAAGASVAGKLTGDAIPGTELPFTVNTDVRVDLVAQRVAASGLVVKAPKLTVAGTDVSVEAVGDVVGDLAKQVFAIDPLRVSGTAQGDGLGGAKATFNLAATVAAALPAKQFSAKSVKLDGVLSGESVPGGEMPVTLTGDVGFDQAADAATITKLALKAAGMRVNSPRLVATSLTGTPQMIRIRGQLEVLGIKPRDLAKLAGQPLPKTADPKVLRAATVKTTIDASAKAATLKPLALKLDDTTITGSVQVKNFAKLAVAFDLSLDGLDADRYLSPKKKNVAATPGAAAASAATLPVETLRGLDIQGRLRAGKLKVSNLRLAKLDVKLAAKNGVIKLSPLSAALYGGQYKGNISLDASGEQIAFALDERISGIRADRLLKDLGVKGNLDLSGGPSHLALKATARGDTAKQQFRFDPIDLTADLAGKSFPGGRLAFGLGAKVDLDLPKESAQASNLRLRFAGAEATGQISVTKFASAPSYRGTLSVPKLNPRKLLAALGQKVPKTADPKALSSARLDTKLTGTAERVTLDALVLKLDASTLKGKINVVNFAQPAIGFNLVVDALDADRYLPPRVAGKKKAIATPGAAAVMVPVETIRGLNVDGKLTVGRLKISNLRLSNIVLTAKAKDGVATLHPIGAKLYKGSYSGNVRIDARDKRPKLSVDEKLSAVQVGPLLRDYNGKKVLSGRANLSAKLNAVGATEAALRQTLKGSMNFSFADGAIEGIDILGLICRGLAGLNLGSLNRENLLSSILQIAGGAKTKSRSNTQFSELKGTVKVGKGVAHNNDLVMKSPLLRVSGKGQFNLVNERVNYLANTALVSSCEGQGGRTAKELTGLNIPVKVSGRVDRLKYEPDLGGVFKALTKGKKSQTPTQTAAPPKVTPQPKASPKKQAEKLIKDLLKGGLKGILGN